MKLQRDKVRYVDLPEVSETFIDSINTVSFDSQAIRIELCVTRLDPPQSTEPQTARKYPACRLVLTPQVTIDLFNQLQNILGVMHKEGIIESMPPVAKETKH